MTHRHAGRSLALLALAWLLVVLLAPLVGSHPVDLSRVLEPGTTDATIVWQLRLPRVLLALLAGGALALSGLGFQTLFRKWLNIGDRFGIQCGISHIHLRLRQRRLRGKSMCR